MFVIIQSLNCDLKRGSSELTCLGKAPSKTMAQFMIAKAFKEHYEQMGVEDLPQLKWDEAGMLATDPCDDIDLYWQVFELEEKKQ